MEYLRRNGRGRRSHRGRRLQPGYRRDVSGAKGVGVTYNGIKASASRTSSLEGAIVLASRSEVEAGKWKCFADAPFVILSQGSIASKLARVAVGLADATWTLESRSEWDIAAGVALVQSAGGHVQLFPNSRPTFNNVHTRLPGIMACGPFLKDQISSLLAPHVDSAKIIPPNRA